LPYADIVVSSLTKVFSGDGNVMGGAAILNPASRYYKMLKGTYDREFEDTFWPEDAIFLERNSRDFVARIERINDNAEALCERLQAHPKGKKCINLRMAITNSLLSKMRLLPQSRPISSFLRCLPYSIWRLRRSSQCYLLH